MSIDLVESSDPRFAELNISRASGLFPTPEESASQIALCHSGDDVALAVEQALHAKKRPTILSSGHCYEDFIFNNPGGVIIDVRPMSGITQDETTKRWKLEAGASVGEMYKGMYDKGNVTIPAASCTSVGLGGHIAGGGYGFLTRLLGIAPDWISAVDIVTVDHKGKVQLRHVDKNSDPDLLRACRGSGGGSYGVITAFYSDNPPPAPKEVLSGYLGFNWADMTPERLHRIIWLYSNYFDTRGRDADTFGLFTIMNISPGNAAQKRSPGMGMSVMFTNPDGTVENTKVLDEFFEVFDECKPVSQIAHHPSAPGADHLPDPEGKVDIVCLARHNVSKRSWIDFTGANRPPGQFRQRPAAAAGAAGAPARPPRPVMRGPRATKYKSAYMRKPYTLEEATVFYKQMMDASPYNSTGVSMDSFGGAASKPGLLEETSDAHRSSIMKMQFISSWGERTEDAARLDNMRKFYTDLFSASSDGKHAGTPAFNDRTEGCYINYPDVDMTKNSYWPELYWGPGKLYPFLQHVKKKYDPNNVFHHSMSVRA